MTTFKVTPPWGGTKKFEGAQFNTGIVVVSFEAHTGVYDTWYEMETNLTANGYLIEIDTELEDAIEFSNVLLAALATRFRWVPDPYARALGYAERLGKKAGLL